MEICLIKSYAIEGITVYRKYKYKDSKDKKETTVIPCYRVTLYKADFHIKQFLSDHQINPFIVQLIFPRYKVSL